MTRKLLAFALLMVMPGSLLWSQQIMTGNYRKQFPLQPPAYFLTVYDGGNQSSGSVLTSPPITLNAGYIVIPVCKFAFGTSPTATISSSPALTFVTATEASSGSYLYGQIAAAKTTASTSYTFSCSFAGGPQFQEMAIFVYQNFPPSITSISTGTPNGTDTGTAVTTGTFSTSARSLIFACTITGGGVTTNYTAGLIGSGTANPRGFTNGGTPSFEGAIGCQDYLATTSQASIASTMTISPTQLWITSALAIAY